MATTTFKAIRDNMVAIIRGLSPDERRDIPFYLWDGEEPLELWAEGHSYDCMRRFDVVNASDYELPEASDGFTEYTTATAELVVAYPQSYGANSRENRRDLEDLIEQDLHKIDKAIGIHGDANYVAGQTLCRAESKRITDGENIMLLVFELTIEFWREL